MTLDDWYDLTIGNFVDRWLLGDDAEMNQPLSVDDTIPDDTALPDEAWEAKVHAFLEECAQRQQEE